METGTQNYWLTNVGCLVLRLSSSDFCSPASHDALAEASIISLTGGGRELPTDPDKLEYLRRVKAAVRDGRTLVECYNFVLFVVLICFAISHWHERQRDRRKWTAKLEASERSKVAETYDGQVSTTLFPTDDLGDAAATNDGEPLSSSSNTTLETLLPPEPARAVKIDGDLERLPLLGVPPLQQAQGRSYFNLFRFWLAYQPHRLPVVNKLLPSNATSLFILCWAGLNVFFQFYRLVMRWDFFICFADRAGMLFTVNLPLLYLLAAKNQPLKLITGRSYEALNIFHRRVGELLCFQAAVHTFGMILWTFVLMPKWRLRFNTLWEYLNRPLILLGVGAFVSYEFLYVTSLRSFRQRFYEIFLTSHVILQVAALAFLWLHYHTARFYVTLSLVIFLVDRVVWRLWLKSVTVDADIQVLEDGDTFLVSSDWDIPRLSSSCGLRSRWSVLRGWRPTDHVFLSVPALGRKHSIQAHPFTIASAAPLLGTPLHSGREADAESNRQPAHAWFSLLIRAHSGFTLDLLRHARTNPRVSICLDGPYGSSHALHLLRASDCAVLVAGGTGIAVAFPLVWALLQDPAHRAREEDGRIANGKMPWVLKQTTSKRTVHLLWVVQSRSHRGWIPQHELDELVARGLDLVIPEPTVEAGRPDIASLVQRWISASHAGGRETGVVVSGPDGLNRTVRNACARTMRDGVGVRVVVEKFGW